MPQCRDVTPQLFAHPKPSIYLLFFFCAIFVHVWPITPHSHFVTTFFLRFLIFKPWELVKATEKYFPKVFIFAL